MHSAPPLRFLVWCFALPFGSLAAPRIESISPAQGPIAGGTDVVVSGAGFTGATVRLDNTPITPLSLTDTEIRLRMPAHDNGYAVINARAGTGNAYAEFLCVPPRLADLPPGSITTIAGMGHYVRDFGPAINATVAPSGLAFDANGNLYIAEARNNKVSRVRPDGQIERVTASGNSDQPVTDGGLAVDAIVPFPLSLGIDPAGNIYVPDTNGRVRKIDGQTGIITTIAGVGVIGSTGDGGPAQQARVGSVRQVAADANDVFFIEYSDGWNHPRHKIRRVHLADGKIFHVAGTDTPGFSGDGGPAAQAQIDVHDADRGHLALDPSGNLLLADTGNFRVRRIDRTTGIITTFYALPADEVAANRDTAATKIWSLTIDRSSNVYFGGAGKIVKLSPAGQVWRIWGASSQARPADGALASAGFGSPVGLAIDSAGNVLFSDDWMDRVFRIDLATDRLTTVAGIGPSVIGETGLAIATVMSATDVLVDRDGSLLVADPASLRLRRIDHSGRIETFAGNGTQISTPPLPLPALEAFGFATSINLDANGEYDLTQNSSVRHIDRAGLMRYLVSFGAFGYAGDGGPALNAQIDQAWDTVRDAAGNLFIADSNNNRVRRVDARTGIITTVVGNGGPINGFERYGNGQSSGDGGLAIDAAINTPYGLAFDAAGNLYISERPAIRKVDPTGRISTFAPIANTTKLIFDAAGNLYASVIAGVFRLDPAGRQTWVVGGGGAVTQAGFSGDGGAATEAKVHIASQSAGLAIDAEGNLYFCDDNRIRAVRAAAPAGPAPRFPPLPARLSNVSVRAALAASQTLIVGLTASGGARDVLLRAAGPALTSVGVTSPMADPRLDLFNGPSLVASNDNWDGALAATFASVGAFAFANGSQDAALVQSLNGGYTIQSRGTGAGIVLVEAYDLGAANSPRLTNVSVRNAVGTGGNILIAGFTVNGTGNKPLLIRAVGPKLAAFGLSGFLADPKLELYDSTNTKIAENDNWEASLAVIFTSVGAFALDPASQDAALYTVLNPGSYTAQVKGATGGTGEALVEIYEVP